MAGSLTVKAYLQAANEETNIEIRRFAVDQSVCTNFAYLNSKLAQVFPDLNQKSYQLSWKDSENDLIQFSSDEELTEALGYVCDGMFRVFIRDRGEKVQHKGVMCDVCEKAVVGPRFKCVVCPDYDLCYPCERKGLHSEHDMLRMCQPRDRRHPFMGGPCAPPSHPPPPYGPHHPNHPQGFGPGMWPFWKQWKKNCWKRWMQGAEGGAPGCSSKTDKEEGGPKCGSDRCGDKLRGCSRGKSGRCGGRWPKSEEASSQNSNEQPGCSAGDGFEKAENYLQAVGESVAAMLDPFGIDVQYHVEDHKQNDSVHPKTKEEDKRPQEDMMEDVDQQDGNEKMDSNGASPSSQHGSDTGEWTVLGRQNLTTNAPSAEEPRAVYPSLPTMHSNPRIAEALAHMTAMGYRDDGGWLTSLLEAKGGDINTVLDMLQPHKGQ